MFRLAAEAIAIADTATYKDFDEYNVSFPVLCSKSSGNIGALLATDSNFAEGVQGDNTEENVHWMYVLLIQITMWALRFVISLSFPLDMLVFVRCTYESQVIFVLMQAYALAVRKAMPRKEMREMLGKLVDVF